MDFRLSYLFNTLSFFFTRFLPLSLSPFFSFFAGRSNHLIYASIEPKHEERKKRIIKKVCITIVSIFHCAHHFIDCRISCDEVISPSIPLPSVPLVRRCLVFFPHLNSSASLMIRSVLILCWLLFNAQKHIFEHTYRHVPVPWCFCRRRCRRRRLMRFWKGLIELACVLSRYTLCVGFIIRPFFDFALSSSIVWQTPIVGILLKFQRFNLFPKCSHHCRSFCAT